MNVTAVLNSTGLSSRDVTHHPNRDPFAMPATDPEKNSQVIFTWDRLGTCEDGIQKNQVLAETRSRNLPGTNHNDDCHI